MDPDGDIPYVQEEQVSLEVRHKYIVSAYFEQVAIT